jgi:BirA family biotin operon repressor/biotin-[acetyl-CoA-carboxylase] ligase
VAAARAVAACGCADVRLKWPNDLLLAGAKFGGILVEITGELGERCHCVVGVGLNVNSPPVLSGGDPREVTCMADHATAHVQRNELAARLLSSLVEVLDGFNRAGFVPFRDEWEALHAYRDQPVRVLRGDDVFEGVARSVDDDGALCIEETSGRMRRITTGEVMA